MGIFCCGAAPAEPPTDEAYKAAELILALSKRDRGKVMNAANKKSRLEKKAEKKAAKAEKKAAKQAKKAAKKGGKGDKKGKGKGGQKDEGDALLDEIDMPETAVEKFDAVFGPAGEVLSTGVLLNNGTLTCVENFKSAAAGLLGGYQVGSLQLEGDAASFAVLGTEGDDDVSIAMCKGAADVEVLKGESFGKLSSKPSVQAANTALAELHKAAKDAQLVLECDRGILRFSAASKEEASRGKKYNKAVAALVRGRRGQTLELEGPERAQFVASTPSRLRSDTVCGSQSAFACASADRLQPRLCLGQDSDSQGGARWRPDAGGVGGERQC